MFTDRRLLTILLIVFVQMIGASMVNPILPLYAQSAFAMEPAVITLLLTSFFAAQFVAGPFIGRLSDRRGRLPILLLSQVGTVIAFLMIGLAQSVFVLFFARVLDGITGGNIVVAQAYVTDIMPAQKRTQALGYVMAAFGLGFIVGPALGGLLASQFGPSIPFLFAAAAALLTVLLTWLTLEESLTSADQARNRHSPAASMKASELLRNAPLMAVMVVSFIGRFGFGLLIGTFALFAEQVIFAGADFEAVSLGVGLLLMVVGVGQFITQMLILPATLRRWSDPFIVMLGTASRAIALFLLAIAVEPLLASMSMLGFALGSGLLLPALQSLATKTVAAEMRGGILGLHQSVMSLGVIIATAVSGLIFELDATLPNWIGAILVTLALLPGFMLWRWSQKNQSADAADLAVAPS